MATAARNVYIDEVREVIVHEVEVREVILTLTDDEAQFLADVLSRVGGHPDQTRRIHGSAVLRALRSEGIRYQSVKDPFCDAKGYIQFESIVPSDPWAVASDEPPF